MIKFEYSLGVSLSAFSNTLDRLGSEKTRLDALVRLLRTFSSDLLRVLVANYFSGGMELPRRVQISFQDFRQKMFELCPTNTALAILIFRKLEGISKLAASR